MKGIVLDTSGKEIVEVTLPKVFETPIRSDLIHRVFTIMRTHNHHPQGRYLMAGMQTTAETYNPPTGRGVARVPRVKGERYSRSGMAGGIASVVKGRQAHPPRPAKYIWRKVNKKERKIALASAIAATANQGLVQSRGHRIENVKQFPLILSDDIEELKKAKDLKTVFESIGVQSEIQRTSVRKKASGTQRARGRSTRKKKGPLIIVTDFRGVEKTASSFPGVDVQRVGRLSVLDLAPGSHPGRLVIWSRGAIAALGGTKTDEK
jgi:large subunit ribosomal protein L4e